MKINLWIDREAVSHRVGRVAAVAGVLGCALAGLVPASQPPGNGVALARGEVQAPDDRDDEEEEMMVRQVMRDNCLICHSEEMVTDQRLTRPQWKAEVEKMMGMGSPLPADQSGPLINYLAEKYSEATPGTMPKRLTYAQALETVRPDGPETPHSGGDPDRGATLFAANCATCHGPTAQGADLGPNLVEVAVLLRQADFREVTRNGRRRMPGFKAVLNPEQESDVIAWLRTRRYSPSATK